MTNHPTMKIDYAIVPALRGNASSDAPRYDEY